MGEGSRHIVMFDGVCNLCDGFVNFVFDRDGQKEFFFCPQQSRLGQEILVKWNLPRDLSTIFYIDEPQGKAYSKSAAVLSILHRLNYPWPALYYFIWIPYFVRDFVYSLIAGTRYKTFGKHNGACPFKPGLGRRFLDTTDLDQLESQEDHHCSFHSDTVKDV